MSEQPQGGTHTATSLKPGQGMAENAPQTKTPEKILGKFDSVDDLAKAYKELESKLGQPKDPEAKQEAASEGAEKKAEEGQKAPEAGDKAAAEAVAKAGLDMSALQAEFSEKGELGAESLAALEKAGIDRKTVDGYIEGRKAVAERTAEVLHKEFGAPERIAQAREWAAQNMSQEEIAAYNDLVQTGDMAKMKVALRGLMSSFTAAMGVEPNLLHGGRPRADAYENMAQLRADLSDPRYDRDAAFRARVQAKVDRSPGI